MAEEYNLKYSAEKIDEILEKADNISIANGKTAGLAKISDSYDESKTSADGWAASPAAVNEVKKITDSNGNRATSLESRVKNLNFMKPGDPATTGFLNAMGTGGQAASVTWETASDGANYLVFTVQGTRVCAIRGFCGFNII